MGNSSSNATWPETFLMRFSGMLSLVEMCSEVTSLQETESWMWLLMWVVPSQVEQLTFPLAWRYRHENCLTQTTSQT